MRVRPGWVGEVIEPSLRTTALEDPVFETCVVEVIGHLRFPTPPGEGPLRISYPLVFIPEGWPSPEDQAPPG